jgi:hypothetical protein
VRVRVCSNFDIKDNAAAGRVVKAGDNLVFIAVIGCNVTDVFNNVSVSLLVSREDRVSFSGPASVAINCSKDERRFL